MIREFIGPRTIAIFVGLFVLVWVVLFAWMQANREQHRFWLTYAKIPFISMVVAAVVVGMVVVFIQIF